MLNSGNYVTKIILHPTVALLWHRLLCSQECDLITNPGNGLNTFHFDLPQLTLLSHLWVSIGHYLTIEQMDLIALKSEKQRHLHIFHFMLQISPLYTLFPLTFSIVMPCTNSTLLQCFLPDCLVHPPPYLDPQD